MVDMARGPGGRMSTTRWSPKSRGHSNGNSGGVEIKANTGAQFISCLAPTIAGGGGTASAASAGAGAGAGGADLKPVAASLLLEWVKEEDPGLLCGPKENVPKHSRCFLLGDPSVYHDYECPLGTNMIAKHFLAAAKPDNIFFGTRLERLERSRGEGWLPILETADLSNKRSAGRKGQRPNEKVASDALGHFDAAVLALPPKDILRLFPKNSGSTGDHDRHQLSQADLHSRTNKRNTTNRHTGGLEFALDTATTRKLQTISYVGRFSLILWFEASQSAASYVKSAVESFQTCSQPDCIVDAVVSQANGRVLVVQSTVEYWKNSNRNRAKKDLLHALDIVIATQRDGARLQVPRTVNVKLVNWRTAQVRQSLLGAKESTVVASTEPPLVFTGDWCVESSFEGCSLAAQAAAKAVVRALRLVPEQ